MFKKFCASLSIVGLLASGFLLADSGTTIFPKPQRQIARGYQTVPSSLTDVTTTNTVIYQLTVANKTGTAATLLIQDRQGTSKTIIPTVSIAANTVYVIAWPEGTYCTGGMKWQAGTGSALDAEIVAVQQ